MFRKLAFSLALACGALVAPSSHAAIVSLDYSGTLSSGDAFQGTISWDASATGTPSYAGSTYNYNLLSFSLFVGGTDYSQYLSGAKATAVQSASNKDPLQFLAIVSSTATGALASADLLSLLLTDDTGNMFSSPAALPSNLDFVSSAGAMTFSIVGASTVTGKPTITATPQAADPSPSNDIPEPGTLPLWALAGLALMASHRRPAQRAARPAHVV